MLVNGLHKEFVPSILFHLSKGALSEQQLKNETKGILAKANNVAHLHELLAEFQELHNYICVYWLKL